MPTTTNQSSRSFRDEEPSRAFQTCPSAPVEPRIGLPGGPTETITAVVDEPDNRMLEAAVAGAADHIISGDHHLLELGAYEQIPIHSPAVF